MLFAVNEKDALLYDVRLWVTKYGAFLPYSSILSCAGNYSDISSLWATRYSKERDVY